MVGFFFIIQNCYELLKRKEFHIAILMMVGFYICQNCYALLRRKVFHTAILMFFLYNFPQDAGSASFLRVLHSDNVISVLHEIHAEELKHSGYKKVLDYIQRQYQGPTRNLIQKFCSTCPTCQLSAPQICRPPLNPMVEKDFLEHVQLDLIDV